MATALQLPSLPASFSQLQKEPWSEEQFFEWCECNRDLRVERYGVREIILMSPTGSGTSGINFRILVQLGIWTETDGTGLGFESNGGFRLQDGSMLAPDAAWLRQDRWEALSADEQNRFAPICPDFVIEVRSATERTDVLRQKMNTWLANGAQLGWLVDPQTRTIEVYRPGKEAELLEDPSEVAGEGPVAGFVLRMSKVWG